MKISKQNTCVKCLVAFALFCVVVECVKPEEDYYKTLGVPKDASNADIKRAFRQLSIKYHPDKGGDPANYEKISHGIKKIFLTTINSFLN